MTIKGNRPVIVLDKVSLSYRTNKKLFSVGQHHILKNFSVSVSAGETLGIIGKNGSGKSSILRLMAGIIAPASGTVKVCAGVTPSLLTLGLGFRTDLSGRDNVFLASVLQGASKQQARLYLNEVQSFSELGDSFDEPVKTYSSGMLARLGFSTALTNNVSVLLIDEVLSVGDGHFRDKALSAIKEKMKGDQTVVFVSHSLTQVKDVCDRVLWIEDGKIEQIGATKEVVDSYYRALSLTV